MSIHEYGWSDYWNVFGTNGSKALRNAQEIHRYVLLA